MLSRTWGRLAVVNITDRIMNVLIRRGETLTTSSDLDQVSPEYDFKEQHAIKVRSDQNSLFKIALAFKLRDDPLIRFFLSLRFPARRLKASDATDMFDFEDFIVLREIPSKEIIRGLLGTFDSSNTSPVMRSPSDFIHFTRPGFYKVFVSIMVTSITKGECLLTTETRIKCTDRKTKRIFLPYWICIRWVSGILRLRMLNHIKKISEQGGDINVSAR